MRAKLRMLVHKLAVWLKLSTLKCPFCGGDNWPQYETAKQYHCKNCAKRWNKIDGSTPRYEVHKTNF